MVVLLLRYLCGFVKIRISGDYPERFLNIAALNNIKLWGIKKLDGSIVAFMSVKDFKRIRPYKHKAALSIKLLSKYGLWFILKPYKRRFGIPVGIAAFFAVNFILSQFVWNITVTGNEALSKSTIISYCRDIGIAEGTPTDCIDTNSARLKLLMKHGELSWASFIIEGSHLTVNVSETVKEEDKDRQPANFVAAKDGVIEKVTVSAGKATVKVGDPVTTGDLIATGAMEYTDGTTALTHCRGKIFAKTKTQKTVFMPFRSTKTVLTENKESRKVLSFFNLKLPLDPRPFGLKGKAVIEKEHPQWGDAYLPIYEYNITVTERRRKAIVKSQELAKSDALKALSRYERQFPDDTEILSKMDKIETDSTGVFVTREYVLRENIARLEKIKIPTVQKD